MAETADHTSLLQISPGLTPERLSRDLSQWFNEDLKFTHWQYVSETGKGDSYLSEVMRIRIFGENKKGVSKYVQVILKNIPKNTARRLTFRSDEFFRNEITFYTQILPVMINFQSKRNPKEPFHNFAKLFSFYIDGVNDYICLQDAVLENYGSAIRQEGIDLDHSKVTLKTFAKFHAISFAMRDQEPDLLKKLSKKTFETYYHERLWPWYQRFWARLCSIAIDAVEKEYPNTIYAEKIREFAVPERYEIMIAAINNTKETTGVISHGDAWTNNFLYKYDGKKPVDAKMIDFQLTRCASPILDISFFIYACTTQDMREKHYDELLQYYYDVLSKQIQDLGTDPNKIYSWDKFMEEVKKYSYFGLAYSFESTPFIVLDPEDAVNMEMKGDSKQNIDEIWQMKPFQTKEGRLREADNFVHGVDNGYV